MTAPKKQTVKSTAEQMLLTDLEAMQMPPVVGHMFHGERLWRFDLCYPPLLLAIEIDGRGRHQREKGEREDMEKINAAIELGWKVLKYPAGSVTTHKRRARIVEQIHRIVCGVQCEDSSACVLTGE